jgi:glycosyltransferase involved in cell wall biosynthesis
LLIVSNRSSLLQKFSFVKINFIIAGLSRKSTGVFEVSRQLALQLTEHRHVINAFGLADEHTAQDSLLWAPVSTSSFVPARPRPLGYSRAYRSALLSTSADISHLHVLWMYQSALAHEWSRKFRKPFVTSVNAMLDPWAVRNSQLKKKIAWLMYEQYAMKACSCFFVNTRQEYEYVREFGLRNPVAVIKNGISIPDLAASYKEAPWTRKVRPGKKVLLYLSRVHPKKGIMNLLKALEVLKAARYPRMDQWALVIVGCKEGGEHEQELAAFVRRSGLEDEVVLLGQYFNEEMQSCYYHADAYVLPTYSDGMPLAALNAWAFGKYTLLTPACNLTNGYSEGIAGKIEPDPDSIAAGLKQLFEMSDGERKARGMRAHAYTRKEYSWKEMAKRTAEVYEWVCYGGETPPVVLLS